MAPERQIGRIPPAAAPGEGTATAVPRDVKLALDQMRRAAETEHGPVTTAELARRCGVAERTLRKHFQRFLGLSPLAWQRRWRLARVRDALLDPRCGESVTAVATRLGFTHLGRFAVEYRRAFGETPSETRRRAAALAETAPASDDTRISRLSLIAPHRPVPTLTILPLRTTAAALPEDHAFAEAAAEQLAATLCCAPGLAVHLAPPGAAPGPDAGAAGARYALAGRLTRSGRRLRVTLRLFDLAESTHLWGDSIEGEDAEPLALLDRVTGAALGTGERIRGAAIAAARRRRPEELDAEGLVLRAMPLVLAAEATSATEALGPIEEAMARDPDSSAASALAAWCRAQRAMYPALHDGGGSDCEAEKARAVALAGRAAALAPDDPLVLVARSGVATVAGRRFEAEALSARALARDPHSSWAWERSAWLHVNLGLPETALDRFRRALRLRPPGLPLANCLAGIGVSHFIIGGYADAARWMQLAIAENPRAAWFNRVLAPALLRIGEHRAAHDSAEAYRRAHPAASATRNTCLPATFHEGRWDAGFAVIREGLNALGFPP